MCGREYIVGHGQILFFYKKVKPKMLFEFAVIWIFLYSSFFIVFIFNFFSSVCFSLFLNVFFTPSPNQENP